MPQPKRRKLSVDEQDAKESEKNRAGSGPEERVGKQANNDVGKGSSSHLSDKRTAKNEKKTESVMQPSSLIMTSDDCRDGNLPSAVADGCGRMTSSGRVIKQTNKGRCFSAALEAAQNKQSTSTTAGQGTGQGTSATVHPTPKTNTGKVSTPVRRKRTRKRSRDVWSKFEQDAFFEGLFEHGKDFDAIHNLLVFRSKKRGIETALIKTKEQVRYLYYRMWQKISKHVRMGNDVKKEAQEIYGLVNYYAIRKFFKRIDERAVEHLNELIHSGVSKVRDTNVTGKKNRKKLRVLRTPVCNALKKLNNIDDAKEESVSGMPQQVTVELTPRSSVAWLKVHNLSHNPRVRFQVSVNRSLSSLMEHLNKKWTSPNDRIRKSLGGECESDEMVVFPHHSYTLKPVALAPQRATTVDLITFSSYRDNVLSCSSSGGRSSKKGNEEGKPVGENFSDGDGQKTGDYSKCPKSSVKTNLLPKLSDPMVQLSQPPCEDENAMFPDAPLFSSPSRCDSNMKPQSVVDTTTNDISIPVNSNCDNSCEPKPMDSSPDTSPQGKEKLKDYRDEERETHTRRLMEAASKGFTCESGKLVTLAQLSLMLGKTALISLEYEWHPASTAENVPGTGTGVAGDVERLTNMLRRLSNLASLEYRDILQRGKVTGGGKMSQCTLCGSAFEKGASRKKATADASTETDMVTEEVVGEVKRVHAATAALNSKGTLVAMSSKSKFINTLQKPDKDGVFRVPMPVAVPALVQTGSHYRMSTQSAVGQLFRTPELEPSKASFMLPKRKKQKRPITASPKRTLLPKISGEQVLIVPQSFVQSQAQSPELDISQDCFQSIPQESEIGGEKAVSSAMSSVSAVDEGHAAVPAAPVVRLVGENSLDMFNCNLDMPVIISPTSSPVKCTAQLISSSISPPSLSSMLDLSLSAPANQTADAGDRFLDTLANENSGFSALLKSPVKSSNPSVTDAGAQLIVNPSQHDELNTPRHGLNTPQHVMATPPHSLSSPPHNSPLKSDADTPWLGGEGPDLSLSGLEDIPVKKSGLAENSSSMDLGVQSLSRFLESPVKKESQEGNALAMPASNVTSSSSGTMSSSFIPAPPSLFGESSQDSLVARLDMDTAVQGIMTESSIDYSVKFERLAEHLAENTDASQPNM